MNDLRAPFPYFGGKRRVAAQVWAALGDVDNYVEPFAGSLAVLLGRPGWHVNRCETVNDADRFLANFWRALADDPAAVAYWADWPVNEADLEARHLWLVTDGAARLDAMYADPEFYDAKVAGWWVWGLCAWIGSGWCSGTGPWKRPHLGDEGRGINRQRPHLGDEGRGINRQLPHLGNEGRGNEDLYGYLAGLATRLRRVRVCCGDWTRVVTDGALSYGTTTGIFLDPPYLGDVRTSDLYAVDDHTIATDVREWALAHPHRRIVLAGYETEHIAHMPADWQMIAYTANKAYGSSNGGGVNDANRHLERLWLSPACLTHRQPSLFDEVSA